MMICLIRVVVLGVSSPFYHAEHIVNSENTGNFFLPFFEELWSNILYISSLLPNYFFQGGGDDDVGGDTAQNLLGDLSIKDGIKIHVKSKFKKTDSASSTGRTSSHFGLAPPPQVGGGVFTMLAPPPASSISTENSNVPNADDFDAEFGDFEEA